MSQRFISTVDPKEGVRKVLPRWLVISLRVTAVLIAILLLNFTFRSAIPAYRQQLAITALEDVGAIVHAQPRLSAFWRETLGGELARGFDEVDMVHVTAKSVASDREMVNLVRFPQLKSLRLARKDDNPDVNEYRNGLNPFGWHNVAESTESPISDDGLHYLAGLVELTYLDLANTRITDEGLVHLKPLQNLRHLDLRGVPITDKGVALLGHLVNLEYLDLGETEVDDEALQKLASLTQLEALGLRKTHVTDDGMNVLKKFQRLKWLDIGDTPITDATLENQLPPHSQKIYVWRRDRHKVF